MNKCKIKSDFSDEIALHFEFMPLACLGPPAELTLGGARSGRGTYAWCGAELINVTVPGRGRDRSLYLLGGSLIWYFGTNVYSQSRGKSRPPLK